MMPFNVHKQSNTFIDFEHYSNEVISLKKITTTTHIGHTTFVQGKPLFEYKIKINLIGESVALLILTFETLEKFASNYAITQWS